MPDAKRYARNGLLYTKAEFLDYYGYLRGGEEWQGSTMRNLFEAVHSRDVEAVREVLADPEVDVNAGPPHSEYERYLACTNLWGGGFPGSIDIRRSRFTPLMLAARENLGDITKLLVDDDRVDVNLDNGSEWYPTALASAAVARACSSLEVLLACERVDVNYETASDRAYTAFVAAVEASVWSGGDVEALRLFIQCPRVDVNLAPWVPETVLYGVDWVWQRLEVVRLLLGCPRFDINLGSDGTSEFPFGMACEEANVSSVQEFLQNPRTNVNGIDHDGNTGLHIAARPGRADVVKALLSSASIDPEIRNKRGRTCFEAAIFVKHFFEQPDFCSIEVIRLFLKREAARIESDRARLTMFVRNSPIDFPDDVLKAELYPWVGQRTISPKCVQEVLDSPGDVFSPARKDELAAIFTQHIKKYGVEEDFPMLDFTISEAESNPNEEPFETSQ